MVRTAETFKSRTIDILTAVTVCLASVWLFSTPIRSSGDLLVYAQDDFYYYLVVARNLAKGLGSTFDGTTLTNGYHPLYLALLWAVCHFTTSLRGIFKCFVLLDTASAIVIFLASRAFFARQIKSVWLTNGLALALLGFCIANVYNHMEVTLTLPLGIVFLLLISRVPEEITSRSWVVIGFVASLLVLSRLDSALLVGICGLLALLPTYRSSLTRNKLLALTAGFAPLMMLYLAINQIFFHRLTPISGAAKQLRTAYSFNWHPRFHDPLVTQSLFVIALIVLIYVAARWAKIGEGERIVYTASGLFPFVHWGLNLSLSDWQIWPWYSYSLRFALLCGLAIIGNAFCWLVSSQRRIFVEVPFFALSLIVLLHKHYKVDHTLVEIAAAARSVSAFTETHPGMYAMGDRAGMVGYLSDQPVLQTEGLMMDSAYLEHIRKQDSLRDVLTLYHVNYYVGFSENFNSSWRPVSGCFDAREPAQAGPHSDTMRSVFCEHPVWALLQPSGQTMIFDLRSKVQP